MTANRIQTTDDGALRTDEALALSFCKALFAELAGALANSDAVVRRIALIAAHSKHPETLFCKGCVLPIVDSVSTRFLSAAFSLGPQQIRAALRCEGISNLHQVYAPASGQCGFSTFTWGKNFQRVSKTGKSYPPKSRGYQPCPDFGIVHRGAPKFCILGETKFSRTASRATSLVASVENDLRYYVSLPSAPDDDWDYDYGFGIAYAAGGSGLRECVLHTEYWRESRFVIASFSAPG